MERSKVEKVILESLKNLVPQNIKKSVTLLQNFRDELGVDSIQLVSMVTVFEEKLNFDSLTAISEVDLEEVVTGNDIVELVLKYQK